MLDCETTGIEPYYGLAGTKRLTDGGETRLSSRVLADGLLALGCHPSHIEEFCWYAAEHGAPRVRPRDCGPMTASCYRPRPVRTLPVAGRLVAAVQPLVSGGVSKTLNVPADTTSATIESISWTLGGCA